MEVEMKLRILPLVLFLLVAGCGVRSGEDTGGMEATVHVENPPAAAGSLTIYAVPRVGPRRLVGHLSAAREGSFTFLTGATDQYVLVAEGLGGGRIVSNPITLSPGSTVRWDMTANIALITQ
jgi:hypothetical protein